MPSPETTHRTNVHWPSALQFGLSILAIISLWLTALPLVVLGLVQYFNHAVPPGEAISLLLISTGVAFIGILLIPSAGYSLVRLLGHPIPKARSLPGIIHPALIIIILPIVIGLGYGISKIDAVAWILLPIFHILAIGLPVLLLVYIALRGLPLGSSQRTWGTFGSGAMLAAAVTFTVEGLALIALILLWALSVSLQPEIVSELTSLAEQLQNAPPSPEAITGILAPYMTSPGVLLAVFAFVAVIVPLIEELIKPIGVWLLAGRNLTPVAGFVAGTLCGAGYALVESLLLSSSAETWAVLVTVRIGTAMIHILSTGLMGWVLALTWREGRYIRLGVTYLSVVLLHAMWNSLTLLTVISSLSASYPDLLEYGILSQLGVLAPFGIGTLSIFAFLALIWVNSFLRRAHVDETHSGTVVV